MAGGAAAPQARHRPAVRARTTITPSRSVTSPMTRDDNPENTIPASSLMSHAPDHATSNESWHNLTRRHHRKGDRAVRSTVLYPCLLDRATSESAADGAARRPNPRLVAFGGLGLCGGSWALARSRWYAGVGHGFGRFRRRCLVLSYVVCGVTCRLWFAVAGGVCPLLWAGAR